ncbi:MAG: hypothetical protein CMI08_12690 [Oceanospirillaceae bacterium]|uniref:alpha/beta hydrolase n=2 Tax=unclassified Thalassolituus TaxID=2624967 RepID=UPI000C093C82|nr:alpha/beta hydrolase [Thalassolituus sp. UBA6592]MAK89981.1 hypothetical protein [Thalassolituus sp.]MAS25496.1 hypothetical protein [Oceanospirillaceae bacterium]MAY00030.1 hypothetical protein [Oceanospirillaceae bacterium]MBL36281.1 hypothetical protein [Oceanospirillaceae bacterium]MBS53798.1 hypothetical protein [Oceanospirillaceae bacterium]
MSWSKNGVVSELSAMDWHLSQPAEGALWQQYCDYYSLGLEEEGAVGHYAGLMECSSYQVAVQVWKHADAKGTAVVVHGYYDHVGLYGSLIRFCLQQGWNVVAFDLPGHGLSSGEQAAIDSFQEYDEVFSQVLQQAQAHLPGPLYAFGQSTGGAILINYLLKRHFTAEQNPFAAVSLMAPLVRPKGWASGRIIHTFARFFVRRVKRKFKQNSGNPEFGEFLLRDPLQPHHLNVRWVSALKVWLPYVESLPPSSVMVNIIQGDADQTVDWQHNMKVLAEKFPNQRLKILPGGQHHLVNESPEQRQRIYQQLAEWLTD